MRSQLKHRKCSGCHIRDNASMAESPRRNGAMHPAHTDRANSDK